MGSQCAGFPLEAFGCRIPPNSQRCGPVCSRRVGQPHSNLGWLSSDLTDRETLSRAATWYCGSLKAGTPNTHINKSVKELIQENLRLVQLVAKLEKTVAAEKKAKKKPTRKYEGLLADVGTHAGSIFGKKGSMVGKAAGSILGNMFGWGDYESTPGVMYPVHTNTLFGRQLAQQVPLMHSGDGVTRIAHREYCHDVIMANNFATGTRHHIISPTNSYIFPWLSRVAEGYSQFKILGMSFGFRAWRRILRHSDLWVRCRSQRSMMSVRDFSRLRPRCSAACSPHHASLQTQCFTRWSVTQQRPLAFPDTRE